MQEVSDEVRRDRLFGFFRKYAWIGIMWHPERSVSELDEPIFNELFVVDG